MGGTAATGYVLIMRTDLHSFIGGQAPRQKLEEAHDEHVFKFLDDPGNPDFQGSALLRLNRVLQGDNIATIMGRGRTCPQLAKIRTRAE
jgi:hypothetical protein